MRVIYVNYCIAAQMAQTLNVILASVAGSFYIGQISWLMLYQLWNKQIVLYIDSTKLQLRNTTNWVQKIAPNSL